MPHLISDIPDKLRAILSNAANIFLVIVIIFIFQYIFNSQFTCSCTTAFPYNVLITYLLITSILYIIVRLTNQTRTKVCWTVCCGSFPCILQFFGILLFWTGFVFLDGDFFLCMVTKYNDTMRELPCKNNLTLQEMSITTNNKNWSQCLGYICIAAGLIGWLIPNTKVGMYCERCSCPGLKECCKSKPYYESLYEEFLSVETDKILDEKLHEIAKKRAEILCLQHIVDIEKSQLSKNRTTQMAEDARNAWSEISRPDFYTSDIYDNQKPQLCIYM